MYHEEQRRSTLKTDRRKQFTWMHFTGHIEPMQLSWLALLLLSCSQMFAQHPGDICPQDSNHKQDVAPNPVPTVDPKLFNKRRYRSARVLFSEQPPNSEPSGHQETRGRTKRKVGEPQHRGVYSVCESISLWVGNKTKATDISGNEVTVLPDVNINNVNKKQYFFETTCSSGRASGSGCLGIDARHWNSYCTNSHTFVRALTSFKNLVAWRLIRINVACVCVLSRKSWRQ